MANFPSLTLTDAGRDILAKAISGGNLTFTRVALGDGNAPENPDALTSLVSEKKSSGIDAITIPASATVKIRSVFSNSGLAIGYFAREVGVFATDPDTGTELLYSYSNAGADADYIPGFGAATTVEQVFDIYTTVGNAASVTAVIDPSIVYVSDGDTPNFAGGTFTGDLTIADKIIHAGDTNTAIRFPAADTVTVETGGSERLRITSTGNTGIGTSIPNARLDITRDTAAPTSAIWTGANLTLRDDTGFAANVGGGIIFEGKFNAAGSYSTYGFIRGGKLNAIDGSPVGNLLYGSRGGNHIFVNAAGLTDGTGELVRITSVGNVGIGTSAPDVRVEVIGATTYRTVPNVAFAASNSDTTAPFVAGNDVGAAFIGVGQNASGVQGSLKFMIGASEAMRIATGNVGIGTSVPSQKLDVNGDSVRVRTAKTPASATAAGDQGQIAWDANYIYVCTATNTWKRAALSTW